MRTFSEGRLARSIAYLLTTAFVWTMGLTGVAAIPAAAQFVTRAATTQSVAVVPFANLTRVRPETLGEEASAAVAVELRDRLLLDVLPKADVGLQMRDLGITAPLSDVDLVRLAAELDVALLVTGQVVGVSFLRGPEGRYAEVGLTVRLFDRVARADVNGARVRAKGPASIDASDEVLVSKALEQAAFQAVQAMRERPTITAMVLWATGETVFLNVGSRGGLRAGMKLVAVRGGERIGEVEVTEADALGSYAKLLEGPPLRTGDQLRAVYKLPPTERVARPGVKEQTKKRYETLALAAALLFGLGGYASRTRLLEEGSIIAPRFMATNLANGGELFVSGYLSSFHPLRDVRPTAAAYVTWERYQGGERQRIVGYEIRRSLSAADEVDVILTDFSPDTLVFDVPSSPGIQVVEFGIDVDTGLLDEFRIEFIPWLPEEIDEDTGELTNPTWSEFLDQNDGELIWELGFDFVHYGWIASDPPGDDYGGIYPGRNYQYRIRPILIHTVQVAVGEFDWYIKYDTEFSTYENFVRAISPAGVFPWHYVFAGFSQGVYEIWDVFQNPQVSGNMATFYFYYPVGADEVVIQVARDPNSEFSPDQGLYVQPIPAFGGVPEWINKTSVDVNLDNVPGTNNVYWWRIGGRSSVDTWPPRSWPVDVVNDRGWVWSPRSAFGSGFMDRSALLHEQREMLSRARAPARVPRRAPADRVLRAQ